MNIGTVIRTQRKGCGLTQEEMAKRLGVTASAVNKWESGASLPDVTMLAPIARLLGITVDTLLSFRESLTEQEQRSRIEQLWAMLNGGDYDGAYAFAQGTVATYPNCHNLMLWVAQALDTYYLVMPVHCTEEAERFMADCYDRALACEEESVRIAAADALFQNAVRKEEYERAEGYLCYFSLENPERKRKKALLYGKTGRREEACRAYEELLFTQCQNVRMVLQNLYTLAKEMGDMEWAAYLAEKNRGVVRVYDVGDYAEWASVLEYAVDIQDAELTLEALERVLSTVDTLHAMTHSPLYRHMTFRNMEEGYGEQLRCKLKQEFRADPRLDFLRDDPRLDAILR